MNERMPDIVWINYEYFSLSDSITGMYYITWSFVSICVLLIQWFYHVVFLDKEVTRAWIPETHLRPYRGKEKNSRLSTKVPRQLHVRLSVQLSFCPSVCMRETETQVWPLQSQGSNAFTGFDGFRWSHCTFFHCSCSHILMVSFDNYSVCGPCSGCATYTILIFFVLWVGWFPVISFLLPPFYISFLHSPLPFFSLFSSPSRPLLFFSYLFLFFPTLLVFPLPPLFLLCKRDGVGMVAVWFGIDQLAAIIIYNLLQCWQWTAASLLPPTE